MSHENFIGVGGLVVKSNSYLLVKHTYGEYNGSWIIPGGHVKAGEPLHVAVEREVREETSVKALSQGIISVRSRSRGPSTTDCYIIFLMKYCEGEPLADNYEVDDARFFTFDEVNEMDNIIGLSKIVIRQHAFNTLRFLPRNTDHDPYIPNCEHVQLFM